MSISSLGTILVPLECIWISRNNQFFVGLAQNFDSLCDGYLSYLILFSLAACSSWWNSQSNASWGDTIVCFGTWWWFLFSVSETMILHYVLSAWTMSFLPSAANNFWKTFFLTDVIWGCALVLVALISVFWISWKCLLVHMHHWYVLMISFGMRLCTSFKVCFRKGLGEVTLGTICRNEKSSAATYHEDVALKKHACMVFTWSCEFSVSGHHDPVFLVFLLYLEIQQNLSGCRYCFYDLCLKFWADHNWGIRNWCHLVTPIPFMISLTVWLCECQSYDHAHTCFGAVWPDTTVTFKNLFFLEFSLQL
jgi:hypothetical protein